MMPQAAHKQCEDLDLEIDLLLDAIYRKYSYDFRRYARASIRRRLLNLLAKSDTASISTLQHKLLRDRASFSEVLAALTVPVSDFFRDPGYFIALRHHVLPVLATYPSIKVWVAGCSTGEEAYSIAILLHEAGLLDRTIIYATDISTASLAFAEKGVYPMERAAGFARNYQRAGGTGSLADYCTAAYDGIVFDKRLRKRITFADHCLATDQVFGEVHYVSCRNVLIYFGSALQERAVGLFRGALVPRGFLGLGPAERLPDAARASDFTEVARIERIYRRN